MCKSSVGVRLIGSHLLLAENGSASCLWFSHDFPLFTTITKQRWALSPCFCVWTYFPFLPLLFPFFIVSCHLSEQTWQTVLIVRQHTGERAPGWIWFLLRAVHVAQLVVPADLVLWCAYSHPLCLMSAQKVLQPCGAEHVACAVQLSACLWHRFLLCLQVWPAITHAFLRCRRRTGTWGTLYLKCQPHLWWVCKVSVGIPTTSSLPVITVNHLSPVLGCQHPKTHWKMEALRLVS